MNRKAESGVTLIELLIVMMLISILLGIGIPSYKSVTTSNRIAGEVNGLLGDLQYARSEAIRTGQTVTACASSDGASCNGATWASGWIVFDDPNSNGTVDGGETVLRTQPPFTSGDTFANGDALLSITYNRDGFPMALPNPPEVFSLKDKTGNTTKTRCLSISLTGMMAVQPYGTANGVTCQ